MRDLRNGSKAAGRAISAIFRRMLPSLPEENADTISKIIEMETHSAEMLWVIKQLLSDLPQRRDWLSPDLEKTMKHLVKLGTASPCRCGASMTEHGNIVNRGSIHQPNVNLNQGDCVRTGCKAFDEEQ